MNALAGIPYEIGMTVILLVCILYTLFGGLYAVIGTDFIQSIIILIGIAVIGIGVLSTIDFDVAYETLKEDKPMLISAMLPASIIAIFNNLLFGMGEVFHSNVWWSRAFAMRKDIGKKAYIMSGFFWLPVPIAAGFIALMSGMLGVNIPSPDMVGPLVSAHVLGKGGAIIVFAVFFCSLASSIDSLLAATSDLITEDIYRKLINPKAGEKLLRRVSAYIIIGLGVFAWLVCLPRIGTLATVLFFAGPMVGSTIWPIASGLFWKKVNPKGALLAMVLGTAVGLFAYFQYGWYSASLIGAAVSMLTVLISTWVAPSDFNWKKLDEAPIKTENA